MYHDYDEYLIRKEKNEIIFWSDSLCFQISEFSILSFYTEPKHTHTRTTGN